MKKLISVLIVLSFSLFASDIDEGEILSYSDFNVNKSFSLYAGIINMGYFLEDDAYSIGLLLHDKASSNFDFGFGYIQPSSKFMSFSQVEPEFITTADDDGIVFFINYNF